jgi:hypothetical protein
LLILLVPLGGCAGAGDAAEELEEEARVEPFRGYFETLRPGAVFLFADLQEKQLFERDPSGLVFREYVDLTGTRIFVHVPDVADLARMDVATTRPAVMVERVARGFEVADETRLTLMSDPDAPPINPFRAELALDLESPADFTVEAPATRPRPAALLGQPASTDDAEAILVPRPDAPASSDDATYGGTEPVTGADAADPGSG